MLIALLRDGAECLQACVRAREVRDINLDVVAVVGQVRRCGFPEQQQLPGAHLNLGNGLARVWAHIAWAHIGVPLGTRTHGLAVKARTAT